MANQYTAREISDKRELQKAYENGLTQAEVGRIYGVSQKVVWSWFKKLGIKARVPKNTNQFRENNASWKGDEAGIPAFHKRLVALYGYPKKCEVCGTTKAKAYDWANLTGNYKDIKDYKRMCRSCHWKYDGKIKNITNYKVH